MELLQQQCRKQYNGGIKFVRFQSSSSHLMILFITPKDEFVAATVQQLDRYLTDASHTCENYTQTPD
jgi:hypothetical protein